MLNKMKFRFFSELNQKRNPDFSGKTSKTLKVATAIILGLTLNLELGTSNCSAQSPIYRWAKGAGSTNYDYGNSIAVDGSGNVYITGVFEGTADFDTGTTSDSLTTRGGEEIFFAKYDPNGNYLWAKSIGDASNDRGNGIAVDRNGNVYITGYFEGTVDFDPGAATANLISNSTGVSGGRDIFFAKYDTKGNYLWAKSIGSIKNDMGNSIAVDGSGNVYITGYFQDLADFDPGTGIANLTTVVYYDIFFAKYDSNGNYRWAKSVGSAAWDEGFGIAVDGNGNVYITGKFQLTADFDPGTSTANLTAAGVVGGKVNIDIFFAKYDSSGNYRWAKRIGNDTKDDFSKSIAVDGSGNVYITGYFEGTVDFDPGAANTTLTAEGYTDIFFAKYDVNGNYRWAKRIGSAFEDYGKSIAVDGSGNVYITGAFWGIVDFDPGAATANLTAEGYYDIFFAKYDVNGNYRWAKNIGSTDYSDGGNGIAVDGSGNVYIAGAFSGIVDFDPGAVTANLTSEGYSDIFFAKYDGSTTSIASIAGENNLFSISPNPGSEKFTIKMEDAKMADVKLAVYNVLGERVYSEIVNTQSSIINLSALHTGIYFLQVNTGEHIINKKLVLEKSGN